MACLNVSTRPAQVVDAEVGVGLGAAVLLQAVEGRGEDLGVDAEHRGAEHLEQPAVGVHREPLVVALLGETAHGLVVETDVEDRLHHPGHRDRGAGADADQQRVAGLAEPASHRLLERGEVLVDLAGQAVGQVAGLEVGAAGLGRDREPGRHREPEVGHLGEVRALAAEQVLLVLVALGEVVDVGHGPILPCRRGLGHHRICGLDEPDPGVSRRSRRTPARRPTRRSQGGLDPAGGEVGAALAHLLERCELGLSDLACLLDGSGRAMPASCSPPSKTRQTASSQPPQGGSQSVSRSGPADRSRASSSSTSRAAASCGDSPTSTTPPGRSQSCL